MLSPYAEAGPSSAKPTPRQAVTAVFNGVPNDFFAFRRLRRCAATPPAIHLVPSGLINSARLRLAGVYFANGGAVSRAVKSPRPGAAARARGSVFGLRPTPRRGSEPTVSAAPGVCKKDNGAREAADRKAMCDDEGYDCMNTASVSPPRAASGLMLVFSHSRGLCPGLLAVAPTRGGA